MQNWSFIQRKSILVKWFCAEFFSTAFYFLSVFIFSVLCNSEYLFTFVYLKRKGEKKARTKLESFQIVGSCSSQSSSELKITLLFWELKRKKEFSVNYIIILQHACIGLRETHIETEESFEAQYEKNLVFI